MQEGLAGAFGPVGFVVARDDMIGNGQLAQDAVYGDEFGVEAGIGNVACDDGKVIVAGIYFADDLFEIGFADGARGDVDISEEGDVKGLAGLGLRLGLFRIGEEEEEQRPEK